MTYDESVFDEFDHFDGGVLAGYEDAVAQMRHSTCKTFKVVR